MRFFLALCLALCASGCAQKAVVQAPINPAIEDMGWKAGTTVKTASESDQSIRPAAPQARKPAAATAKTTTAKVMAGAPKQTGSTTTGRIGGSCGKLHKADCQGSCTWIEVKTISKAGDQGYCTAARSF